MQIGPEQAKVGDLCSGAAKIARQSIEHERLAGARWAQQQPQPPALLDEELQPGQRLFVRRALVKQPRRQPAWKRAFAQAPMGSIGRRDGGGVHPWS